ncbi:unnamed protein product [Symbiodinium pilosum]|uniref:Uncharacterized protein n=1 Tax=Symbiodinium pilosum TaxID=2952 RepID=A0A812WXR1_SYMPI|nr:unnamed protein product [Symbiodinium pilosum]
MALGGNFVQHGAYVEFQKCTAPGGRGGGLAVFNGYLHQFAGSMSFYGCGSNIGGGLFVQKDVVMIGTMSFTKCRAMRGGGGGAFVRQNFHQREGQLVLHSCMSLGDGGGLRIGRTFNQESDTSADFISCRATHGGCMSAGSVHASGYNNFSYCVASGHLDSGGGGVHVVHNYSQLAGVTNFIECQALKGGGGLQTRNGSLTVLKGNMVFLACTATGAGGGADVGLDVYLHAKASMAFDKCHAGGDGGGMSLKGNFLHDGANITFQSCEALASRGGGLAVFEGFLHQLAGEMDFRDCHADAGGGMYVERDVILDSTISFSRCHAYRSDSGGGALYIANGQFDLNGHLWAENCSSLGSGGGLLMKSGVIRQKPGSQLTLRQCSAHGGNGGGMATHGFIARGIIQFHSCAASPQGGNGGGLYVGNGNGAMKQEQGLMSFENCTAGGLGGGLYLGSKRAGHLTSLLLDHCSTESDAGTLYSLSKVLVVSDLTVSEPRSVDFDVVTYGKLVLNKLYLQSRSQKFGMGFWADSLHAESVNCTALKSCSLVASECDVSTLLCPPGTGIREGSGSKNCSVCDDNFTQHAGSTVSKCVPCPVPNEFCYANKFKMTPGHMVEASDISFTIYCPNPAACPGGNSSDLSTMCAPGYENRSCATCSVGYAISDNSVLLCTHCATVWWQQISQWMYMLAKHVLPFTLAAHSALQVQGAEEPKRSGVLINQLMSFATVAGTLLTVVTQTNAMREIKQQTAAQMHQPSFGQFMLQMVGLTTDLIAGQGPSEGRKRETKHCVREGRWPCHPLVAAATAQNNLEDLALQLGLHGVGTTEVRELGLWIYLKTNEVRDPTACCDARTVLDTKLGEADMYQHLSFFRKVLPDTALSDMHTMLHHYVFAKAHAKRNAETQNTETAGTSQTQQHVSTDSLLEMYAEFLETRPPVSSEDVVARIGETIRNHLAQATEEQGEHNEATSTEVAESELGAQSTRVQTSEHLDQSYCKESRFRADGRCRRTARELKKRAPYVQYWKDVQRGLWKTWSHRDWYEEHWADGERRSWKNPTSSSAWEMEWDQWEDGTRGDEDGFSSDSSVHGPRGKTRTHMQPASKRSRSTRVTFMEAFTVCNAKKQLKPDWYNMYQRLVTLIDQMMATCTQATYDAMKWKINPVRPGTAVSDNYFVVTPPKPVHLQVQNQMQKVTTPVIIEPRVNIPVFDDDTLQCTNVAYNVWSVILHAGHSPHAGHYTSRLLTATADGASGAQWSTDDARPAKLIMREVMQAIPAALVLGLIAFLPRQQHGVALVVGLNCFWPEMFGYFGKYLYCYQFAPEGTLEKTYDCPFLEDAFHHHAVRFIMLFVLLAVSHLWISLSLPKDDAQLPLHVIFLSRAYRKSCRLWESERLLRKTLLTLAVSALPITSSPALQLVCIVSVVMMSLFLYAALLPYKTMRFNLTECSLLATAALMTAVVSGLTAYDHYWGHMKRVEYLMIFSTVGIAAFTCALATSRSAAGPTHRT